jgi:hypothetical protein
MLLTVAPSSASLFLISVISRTHCAVPVHAVCKLHEHYWEIQAVNELLAVSVKYATANSKRMVESTNMDIETPKTTTVT